jgi:hypothetical protein
MAGNSDVSAYKYVSAAKTPSERLAAPLGGRLLNQHD